MQSATPLLARNIDEVITQLEAIIADAQQRGDRCGFFASLYHKVTVQVKEGVNNGTFANGPRLAELDVLFANRYLYAYDQWRKGGEVSGSWKVAFEATRSRRRLVLQHLLMGMNAHINLDLGIAVVEAANGANLDDMKKDYDAINTILASLTYDIISKLNVISPLLSILGFSGTASNSMLVQFSLGNARDGSWCFAEDLSKKTPDEKAQFLKDRDASIAALGTGIVQHKGFMKLGIGLIHLFEWKNTKRIINTLTTYRRLYKSEIV